MLNVVIVFFINSDETDEKNIFHVGIIFMLFGSGEEQDWEEPEESNEVQSTVNLQTRMLAEKDENKTDDDRLTMADIASPEK